MSYPAKLKWQVTTARLMEVSLLSHNSLPSLVKQVMLQVFAGEECVNGDPRRIAEMARAVAFKGRLVPRPLIIVEDEDASFLQDLPSKPGVLDQQCRILGCVHVDEIVLIPVERFSKEELCGIALKRDKVSAVNVVENLSVVLETLVVAVNGRDLRAVSGDDMLKEPSSASPFPRADFKPLDTWSTSKMADRVHPVACVIRGPVSAEL